jgi:hypothetical protein
MFPKPTVRGSGRGCFLLDVGRDVHRLHGGDRWHAGVLAPGQEFRHAARVAAPRVWVADVGREEFDEAHADALAGGLDESRRGMGGEARRMN